MTVRSNRWSVSAISYMCIPSSESGMYLKLREIRGQHHRRNVFCRRPPLQALNEGLLHLIVSQVKRASVRCHFLRCCDKKTDKRRRRDSRQSLCMRKIDTLRIPANGTVRAVAATMASGQRYIHHMCQHAQGRSTCTYLRSSFPAPPPSNLQWLMFVFVDSRD